jgi:hypothetical protein
MGESMVFSCSVLVWEKIALVIKNFFLDYTRTIHSNSEKSDFFLKQNTPSSCIKRFTLKRILAYVHVSRGIPG